MLKREHAAIAVLALMVGISAWNVRKIEQLTGDIEIAVCKSRTAAEQLDFKSSREFLKDGLELWLSAETYTNCFLSHGKVDAASEAFYELQEQLLEDNATACGPCYDRLKYQLESIRKLERPSIGSIF